jgi:hypothetical protein
MKYRILKSDDGYFKIQERFLWIFWVDTYSHCNDYGIFGVYAKNTFMSKKSAEECIEKISKKSLPPPKWKVIK